MRQPLSAGQLRIIRNHIPINTLIKDVLMIPSKMQEGCFRYLCPVCKEFNTVTYRNSNLARCFRCSKNYNTIDIVIIAKKLNFVEAVKFLKKYLPITPEKKIYGQADTQINKNKLKKSASYTRSSIRADNGPVAISSVINKLGLCCPSQITNHSINQKQSQTISFSSKADFINDQNKSLINRIVHLEKKIEVIHRQIEHILSIVTAQK